MIDLELLSTIIAETIDETTKDITTICTFAQEVARITLLVAESLEKGMSLAASTRSVRTVEEALVWKCAATYREKSKQ